MGFIANSNHIKERCVIVLSGGLDSTTLLYKLIAENKEVHAISINYKQRHSKELEYAKKTCEVLGVPHKIIDMSAINSIMENSALTRDSVAVPDGHYEDESMKITVVPNRNMFLLSVAGTYAVSINATVIYYGAHKGDFSQYPDCRPPFIEAMQKAFELCHFYPIRLEAPFAGITKGDIVVLGKELNVPFENCWSCYKGLDKHCGRCGTDTERKEAFRLAQVPDPTNYEDETGIFK